MGFFSSFLSVSVRESHIWGCMDRDIAKVGWNGGRDGHHGVFFSVLLQPAALIPIWMVWPVRASHTAIDMEGYY